MAALTEHLWAWVRIVRPLIIVISVFGSMVGAINAASFLNAPMEAGLVWSLVAGAALLAGGLMVHNDYTDYASDCVNRPHKPIPSGIISLSTGKWAGIAMLWASVAVALFDPGTSGFSLNFPCAILTVAVVISGIYYNKSGKHTGIVGHMIVAFGVGAIPLWGALKLFSIDGLIILPLSILIFIMETGREIMVCVGDYEGDVAAGYKTTPIRLGRRKAMQLALVFYIVAFALIEPVYSGAGVCAPVFFWPYRVGAYLFFTILFVTWIQTWRVIGSEDSKKIFRAFELYIRTGTRIGVLLFQVFLFADGFI